MKKTNSINNNSPSVVHERILFTLNSLPETIKKFSNNTRNTRVALISAASLIAVLFLTLWTINPVFAQGMNFRQSVREFLGFNPEAQEIIEAPLTAQSISDIAEDQEPGQKEELTETAILTQPDEEGVQVPTVQVSGYIFELETETLYDGVTLVVGYNVRRENGEVMPPEEEYTKDHLAGYIRAFELLIDGEVYNSRSDSPLQLDWSDPYVYRQVVSYDLSGLAKPITAQTEIILRVAVHQYSENPLDTITTFADLPFSINTRHESSADTITAIDTLFTRGDFTVELMPISCSSIRTLITIRAYKTDDPSFGKRMDGQISISVKDLDGNIFPCPPNSTLASMGYGEDESGFTYLEYEWYVDPTFELPKTFQLTFGSTDVNPTTETKYDPIIINLP